MEIKFPKLAMQCAIFYFQAQIIEGHVGNKTMCLHDVSIKMCARRERSEDPVNFNAVDPNLSLHLAFLKKRCLIRICIAYQRL